MADIDEANIRFLALLLSTAEDIARYLDLLKAEAITEYEFATAKASTFKEMIENR